MKRPLVVFAVSVGFCMAAIAWAQSPSRPSPQTQRQALNVTDGIDPDIPRAALLTEKGMQMAARLKMLKESASRMGSRHPSLPEIQRQIAEIKTQLKNWADAPARADGKGTKQRVLSNQELQEIVFQLANEVDMLKQKVARLEIH